MLFIYRLLGPRRKMTNAIARWHSNAGSVVMGDLEQAYADKLEVEMQEMAIQLQIVSPLSMILGGFAVLLSPGSICSRI